MFSDFIENFAPVFAILGVVMSLMAGGVAVTDYAMCKGFGASVGTETRWNFGCYVKKGYQWVPKEYYFGDAHELRVKGE